MNKKYTIEEINELSINDKLLLQIFPNYKTSSQFIKRMYEAEYGFVCTSDDNYIICLNAKKFNLDELKNGILNCDIAYLKKTIEQVYPNTFYFITNIKYEDWFKKGSVVKMILESFPCFNLVCLNYEEKEREELESDNDSRRYKYHSNVYETEEFKHDCVLLFKNRSGHEFLQISRYPDLVEAYDDNRNKFIPLILPLSSNLVDLEYDEIELYGFKESTKSSSYFISSFGDTVKCKLYKEVPFDIFFKLEQHIDLFHVFEGIRVIKNSNDDKDYQSLFFYALNDEENYTCSFCNSDVADIYTVIPFKYDDLSILKKFSSNENNYIVNNIFTGLRFQEHHELGNENQNITKYQDRILRLDLGNFDFLLTKEKQYNYFQKKLNTLVQDEVIKIRLTLSVDILTHTCLLYLINLGAKSNPTLYLDEISRNDIMIKLDNQNISIINKLVKKRLEIDPTYKGKIKTIDNYQGINLYQYLNLTLGLSKMGTPRHLVISPNLSDSSDHTYQTKLSLLNAKGLYEEGYELGQFTLTQTSSIDDEFESEIYDYCKIYMSNNVLLQIGDTFKDYVIERIDFAVVNLFYIELLQFEEAAIQIANNNISKYISEFKDKNRLSLISNTKALKKFSLIHIEYAKTLDFWNLNLNYQTSDKFLKQMRNKFNTDKLLETYERNKEEIESIYKSRNDRIVNFIGFAISIIGGFFTIMQILQFFGVVK